MNPNKRRYFWIVCTSLNDTCTDASKTELETVTFQMYHIPK